MNPLTHFKTIPILTILIALALVALAAPKVARADVVVDWNSIALQTIFAAVPPRPGPTGILDVAMVHAAVHDAIQAFEGRFESYTIPIANASGSPVAAAAQAAHDVLVARFPLQTGTLDTLLTNYLAGLGLLGNPGLVTGQQAAVNILNLRTGDGSFPPNPEIFTGGTGPGEWRPTLPAFAPMASPWLGAVAPFALKDSAQLRASPPPPHLASGKYARDYDELKALGSVGSVARTQAQTDLALSTPTISSFCGNEPCGASRERISAISAIAPGSSPWPTWRQPTQPSPRGATRGTTSSGAPSRPFRKGDNDGNPRTAGDPTWLPLLATPPYPEYTSGANNLTGAMTRTLERFFGDRMTFTVTSTPVNQTKTYDRFSDMADDVVDVRIYQGIHFRSADEVARRQGTRSADWAFSHILRPLE